jgi:hypothetical protein
MKSFTDIEQSKKLVEILPIESADMCYRIVACNQNDTHEYQPYCFVSTLESDIPCWSLTALLNTLPISVDEGQHCLALINPNPNDKTEWLCAYEDCKGDLIMECYADNSIDVCYEMILKLHELKML